MIDLTSDFGKAIKQHLNHQYVIWLTTVDSTVTPQPRPVWFVWENDSFLIFSQAKANKLAHIKKNPKVSLHFNTDESGDRHVVVFTREASIDTDCPPAHLVQVYFENIKRALTGWI